MILVQQVDPDHPGETFPVCEAFRHQGAEPHTDFRIKAPEFTDKAPDNSNNNPRLTAGITDYREDFLSFLARKSKNM